MKSSVFSVAIILLTFVTLVAFVRCHKKDDVTYTRDIIQVYIDNAKKVTITNGVWGTVSSMEGNCMPMLPPPTSDCKETPVKRTVMIYQYTLQTNAIAFNNPPGFYDSFNTALVAKVNTDDDGFFQANIPSGHYTIAIVENGKLYATNMDAQGGLNSFMLSNGILSFNMEMTYKAVF